MVVARARTRILVASAIALGVGVACGIDAVGTAPAGEATSSSGGSSSGATSSGGASSGSSGDATVDAPCSPTAPEICEDGVDNNCNGKTDCEDPACNQYSCAKSETDWTIVSVRAANADAGAGALDAGDDGGDGGSSACAPGWTNPRTLLADIRTSAAICPCVCGAANGNPCANGTRNVDFRTGSSSCNDGTFNMNLDGQCRALPFTWVSANGADVQPPTNIVQVSCGVTSTLPPVIDDGPLVVCDKGPGGSACTNGSCVLTPGTDKVCLMRAGDTHVCPAAFPTRKVLAPSFTDGRACNACSCTTNATACSNQRMGFYTNAACNQGQRIVVADNSCNAVDGSGNPTHYRYEATANGACVPAAATVGVTGAVTLTTPSTLCCPQ